MKNLNRFILGGAQIGMPEYTKDIDNCLSSSAYELLSEAENLDIEFVDGAANYGNFEIEVGNYFSKTSGSNLQVISKLDPNLKIKSAIDVFDAVSKSVEIIGRKLNTLFIHDSQSIKNWDGPLGEGLQLALSAGLTEYLGCSIYYPSELEEVLKIDELKVIQAPFNVLDKRLIINDHLKFAQKLNKIIHLRSVYLKGLLLRDVLPKNLTFAEQDWKNFKIVCEKFKVHPKEAALGWALANAKNCSFVLGCVNAEQLRQNVKFFCSASLPQEFLKALDLIPSASERTLNPSLW